jgi:hypothetical protein
MLRDLRRLAAEVGPWAAITLYVYAWLWRYYLNLMPHMPPMDTTEQVDAAQPGGPPPTPGPTPPRQLSSPSTHPSPPDVLPVARRDVGDGRPAGANSSASLLRRARGQFDAPASRQAALSEGSTENRTGELTHE